MMRKPTAHEFIRREKNRQIDIENQKFAQRIIDARGSSDLERK